MGREIRMVPANWEHPKQERWPDRFQPMYNRTFEEAAAEWKKEFSDWERGERPDYCSDDSKGLEYWEWNSSPPDRAYYRPWKAEEATWFQVWETVSEGTPVTPPFATKEELVDYLVANGDFWDQKRWRDGDRFMQPKKPGYARAAAEAFVDGDGWVPSMVAIQKADGVEIISGIDIAAAR